MQAPASTSRAEQHRALITPVLRQLFPDLLDPDLADLCKPKAVADDATKLLVRDRQHRPRCVVMISSAVDPDLIQRGVTQARAVAEHLGPKLGAAVLQPLVSGELDARSFAVYPYCKPPPKGRVMSRVHRRTLRPLVLAWLTAVTDATARTPDESGVQTGFRDPLTLLVENTTMETAVRQAADTALDRIASGRWRPRHALMHGDFWLGNILRSRDRTRSDPFAPLAIIDWPGGRVNGYAIYDLVRLCLSVKLSPPTLRAQVARHCQALECDPSDARSHLVAGLAELGTHLGHFPPDRYAALSARCLRTLDEAVPA